MSSILNVQKEISIIFMFDREVMRSHGHLNKPRIRGPVSHEHFVHLKLNMI